VACLANTPIAAQQRGDLLQQNRPGVSPQAEAIGYDGAYPGSMAQSIGHLGAHSNPSCVSSRSVSMRIERGDVTISYADWGGHKIDYHGKVDATGKINAWHTNSDGSSSILSGRIGGDGFTGRLLDAENCAYALTMPAPAVATAPATR
jgi:hypothetical protein